MPSKVLIIGCGYVGLPLALRLLQQNHLVTGWVHSEATAAALKVHPFQRIIVGSVASENIWISLSEKFDTVIHCASSGRGGAEAYEEVFLQGILKINAHQATARRLFVSSTSVYGQTSGEIVTEQSPAEPSTETGRMLRQAEASALDSGAIVIRSAGIYGPNRAMLWEKFRRGEAVIEGDGLRWINQIHRDDLVAALLHLIDHGVPSEIYNASDDSPVTQLDFYRWCADYLKKPLPPYGPVNPNRKRGLTNKRVSNAKLRATGWIPEYSSFREGLDVDYREV